MTAQIISFDSCRLPPANKCNNLLTCCPAVD
jgi:hypothetical protein